MSSIPQRIADLQQRYDQIERAADFAAIARLLLAGQGQFQVSRDLAQSAPRVSERVRRIMTAPGAGNIFVRAAQQPQTLAGTPALTDYRIAEQGFAASLANIGIYDRLLGQGFRRLPMGLFVVGAVNIGAAGFTVDEAAPKPVSSISLSSATTNIRKAVALVIVTAELARATDAADSVIAAELRTSCVKAIDAKFLSLAIAGAPTASASGSNLPAFFADLGIMLNAVSIDDSSRLYLIMTSANAKQLSLMLAAASTTAAAMTPGGGVVAGIPVLVSDALGAGQMVLVDSAAFAAASDVLTLSTLTHSSIQFDSSPDSPSTAASNFLSLWQLNKIGLLAERFYILEKLRSASCAVVTGASYASGFSP